MHITYCSWWHSVTSCSFHSVCVSLWGVRSYSITYVNFKVLYIGRDNDVNFTFYCCLCQLCSIQNEMVRYGLIQMVSIEWHVFQWTKDVQPFYGKGPHPLLWAGSRVARGKITSVRLQLHYCGLCPRVGDPWRKRNCTVNRSLVTLQLSQAPLIVDVVSVAVL
jgi:hypothetical protein